MTKRRKRDRRFPIGDNYPGDDDTIIYKISGSAGDFLIGGETVFINDQGIQVVSSLTGNYDNQNAYTFIDDGGYDIGGLYARDDSGQNIVALKAVDEPAAGDDVYLYIDATAEPSGDASAKAVVALSANRTGESDNPSITMTHGSSQNDIQISAEDFIRITPKLNLLGSSFELCDIYITGTYFVIKYNDSGTTRYKYLDLSGTGTTWTHSTSEP